MYSSANNNFPKTSILSLKEILGIVIVFSFVLYLLFPKGDIENLIIESNENTNLSINYLESMLLYYPDNIKLQMSLVKNYRFHGDLNKAIKLNDELMKKKVSQEFLYQLHENKYLLLKDSYFQTTDKREQKRLLIKVQQSLLAYFNYKKKKRDYFFFFTEATQMQIPKLEYIALQGLMNQQKDLRIHELEEQAFYLAISLEKKEDAYTYLQKLLQYPELNTKIAEDALNLLMEHKKYTQVANLATKLFLATKNKKEEVRLFNIALYALMQNPKEQHKTIQKLIQHYLSRHALTTHDIIMVVKSFLQIGALNEANDFVQQSFATYPKAFNEKALKLSINSFVYNNQLPFAQTLASFAYEKFPTQKWLDKKIQIATWLGDVQEIVASNSEGYRVFGDNKYETYLLKSTTLNTAYGILGEIYQNKVESGAYTFADKLAEYFEYTGEIPKGEKYFLILSQRIHNEPIQRQAILFSYKNSHFAQGIAIYENYKERYGIDKWLQQLSIEKLLALKEFKKAQHYAQALEPTKVYNATAQKLLEKLHLPNNSDFYTQLIDLSWMHKSYPYLYKILWKLEKQKTLTATGYEKLIQLERAMNHGERITYLYEQSWEQTGNSSYLFALFYKYSEDKNFDALSKLIATLNVETKKSLEKSIQYQILLANYYAQTTQMDKALATFKKALKLDKNSASTHQSYLWFLLDNHQTKALEKEITLLRKSPKLQRQVGLPSVVAALQHQKHTLALRWLKPLLNADKKNREYQFLHSNILELQEQKNNSQNRDNSHLFNTKIASHYTHLSDKITALESEVYYRWHLFKGIESKLSFKEYRYQQSNISDHTLALTLKNSHKKFLWEFTLEQHKSKNDFLSASLKTQYQLSDLTMGMNAKYQAKTIQTPELQTNAIMNSFELTLQKPLSHRIQVGASYKYNRYSYQNKEKLGESKHLQLNANYLLRAGYPDIHINSYLNYNRYNFLIQDYLLPQDFSELGTQLSIGTNTKESFHRSWRPFASIGLALNSHQNMGTSLSLGMAGMVNSEDALSLQFNYSNGIGTISNPVYGTSINYRF